MNSEVKAESRSASRSPDVKSESRSRSRSLASRGSVDSFDNMDAAELAVGLRAHLADAGRVVKSERSRSRSPAVAAAEPAAPSVLAATSNHPPCLIATSKFPSPIPPDSARDLPDASADAEPIDIEPADVVFINSIEGSVLLWPELLQNVLHRCQGVGQVLSYLVDHNGWLWVRFATERQAARIVARLNGRAIENERFHMQVTQTRGMDWPPGMTPPRLIGRGPKEPMPPYL